MLCLGVSFCAAVLTYWPDGLASFRYDRTAILSGQGWRLATGHLVHLNAAHLLFNLIGLFLLAELLWDRLPMLHGLGLLGAASIGISGLLWLFHPELAWYAGLSGALHGLWAGCALAGLLAPSKDRPMQCMVSAAWTRHRTSCLIGMLLLIVKLGAEWRYGASARTEQIIGAPVVVAAHLYGALAGIGYVLVWRMAGLLRLKSNG